jgi:flagellar biosynthesis chaperone FliJ
LDCIQKGISTHVLINGELFIETLAQHEIDAKRAQREDEAANKISNETLAKKLDAFLAALESTQKQQNDKINDICRIVKELATDMTKMKKKRSFTTGGEE